MTGQLAEGTFDLCLIDFGSLLALEPAFAVAGTWRQGVVYGALCHAASRDGCLCSARDTDDIPDLRALRMSPAIDVYAAASTVYSLPAMPYEAAPSTSGTWKRMCKKTRDIASPYRLKTDDNGPTIPLVPMRPVVI